MHLLLAFPNAQRCKKTEGSDILSCIFTNQVVFKIHSIFVACFLSAGLLTNVLTNLLEIWGGFVMVMEHSVKFYGLFSKIRTLRLLKCCSCHLSGCCLTYLSNVASFLITWHQCFFCKRIFSGTVIWWQSM